jgi:hypothetical protein
VKLALRLRENTFEEVFHIEIININTSFHWVQSLLDPHRINTPCTV